MNNNEKVLKNINENFKNYRRHNNYVTEEVGTVISLIKEKTHYLSELAYFKKSKYEVIQNNKTNEINVKYEKILTNIIDDLTDTCHRISEFHQASKELDIEKFACIYSNKNKGKANE